MGVFLRIQRFVDNLDVSPKYYYCLLFSEFVLIAITLRLKNEVFVNQVVEEKHTIMEIFFFLTKMLGFDV